MSVSTMTSLSMSVSAMSSPSVFISTISATTSWSAWSTTRTWTRFFRFNELECSKIYFFFVIILNISNLINAPQKNNKINTIFCIYSPHTNKKTDKFHYSPFFFLKKKERNKKRAYVLVKGKKKESINVVNDTLHVAILSNSRLQILARIIISIFIFHFFKEAE